MYLYIYTIRFQTINDFDEEGKDYTRRRYIPFSLFLIIIISYLFIYLFW